MARLVMAPAVRCYTCSAKRMKRANDVARATRAYRESGDTKGACKWCETPFATRTPQTFCSRACVGRWHRYRRPEGRALVLARGKERLRAYYLAKGARQGVAA
jgi:hypothetical protein